LVYSNWVLGSIVLCLLCVSAFFSGSETGMMALNTYKLRAAAKQKNKAAIKVQKLLLRTDRLIGVILLGNTFANILASAVMTILAVKIFGEFGVLLATIALTIVVLLFAEVMPKTLAAAYPEKVAYKAASVLSFILKVFYPLVWLINSVSNKVLSFFNFDVSKQHNNSLQREDLIEIIKDDASSLSILDQQMLTGVLDLARINVEDVMIPRGQVEVIDISMPWYKVLDRLKNISASQILVVQRNISSHVGLLHTKDLIRLAIDGGLTKTMLIRSLKKIVYIPEGVSVSQQLAIFKKNKYTIGLIVDEYGEVLGLLSLEDILGEIIGEIFENNFNENYASVRKIKGGIKVAGDANVRDLNREYGWGLPDNGPNTLSGLIIEFLEFIPKSSLCLKLGGIYLEVLSYDEQRIVWVKVLDFQGVSGSE
jgi:Mg2+/Co2+ transporter CorB